MLVHAITHVPFEGPAAIGDWARSCGHELATTASVTEDYPDPAGLDLLVVMGGPMDADDEVASPWLVAEKRFIARALDVGVSVVGVCLGAQILAEVLGGSVLRNPQREIGWYEVRLSAAGRGEPLLAGWPVTFVCGHWHGDTFELPPGVRSLASSEACANQLFVAAEGRAVGMQFHLEWDGPGLAALLAACGGELDDAAQSVATSAELMSGLAVHGEQSRTMLFSLLDALAASRCDEVLG